MKQFFINTWDFLWNTAWFGMKVLFWLLIGLVALITSFWLIFRKKGKNSKRVKSVRIKK